MFDPIDQPNQNRSDKPEKNSAYQVILQNDVTFWNPRQDVHVAMSRIANATWINTGEGTVLIDTLLKPEAARHILSQMEASNTEVNTIIYTHHHADHIGGSTVFEPFQPKVIAHRFFPDNLERYRRLKLHRSRIASIQFNIPVNPSKQKPILQPTALYDHTMRFQLGDKTFELFHARAETDDATWVYIPEINTVVVGDLIISGLPNIGNPFKPVRFASSWARALEAVRDKQPDLLIAHGGRAVYEGDEIGELLDVTIEAIHSLVDQVIDSINQDIPINEMIHRIHLPSHLQGHEYLQPIYSRTEFAVYNIYRWYHGYFDHNPAHLIPRPDQEIGQEIVNLIGDPQKILHRAIELFESKKQQLALQVVDLLLSQDQNHRQALKLRLEIMQDICGQDTCLMSRNTWVHFIEKDREMLDQTSS